MRKGRKRRHETIGTLDAHWQYLTDEERDVLKHLVQEIERRRHEQQIQELADTDILASVPPNF